MLKSKCCNEYLSVREHENGAYYECPKCNNCLGFTFDFGTLGNDEKEISDANV